MASVINDPNGRRRIQFIASDGKKRTIRIGKVAKRDAELFKLRIEKLIAASITDNSLDDETSRWLADRDDKTYSRIAAVGLVPTRRRRTMRLEDFLTELFATLDVKPNTLRNYAQARLCLEHYFGRSRPLRSITPMDADQFRSWLAGERANEAGEKKNLATATIAKWIIIARQLFKVACKWKLIAENPFADVKTGSQSNPERMYFISRDEAQKVLDKCPDAQWRLMFALSRFGGLRCPSEHLALKWSDVDFEHKRIRVPSSKTEHHAGKGERTVPMFPELEPLLLQVFNEADPGTQHVIARYRGTRHNLRTQLCRIIRRAGLTVWPRPWHNLRATRQTELAESFPIHVVCKWIGNSRAVAQEHYLQVTDSHFSRAVGAKSGDEKATQKATQQPAAPTRSASQIASLSCPDSIKTDISNSYEGEKRSLQESNL